MAIHWIIQQQKNEWEEFDDQEIKNITMSLWNLKKHKTKWKLNHTRFKKEKK